MNLDDYVDGMEMPEVSCETVHPKVIAAIDDIYEDHEMVDAEIGEFAVQAASCTATELGRIFSENGKIAAVSDGRFALVAESQAEMLDMFMTISITTVTAYIREINHDRANKQK